MKTEQQIRAELEAAHQLDRNLKLNSPEFKANRQVIGKLSKELADLAPLPESTVAEWVKEQSLMARIKMASLESKSSSSNAAGDDNKLQEVA